MKNEGFPSSTTYKVKKGDTLYQISQMHNTTVAKLKSWNNLKSDTIFPNQKLSIVANAKKSKKAVFTANKSASKVLSRSTSTNAVKEFTVRQPHIQLIVTVVPVSRKRAST